jgi:hypothetical protein
VQCPAFGPGIACPVPIPRFLSASTSFNSPPLINSSLAPAASPPERANNSSGLGGGSLRRNQSCSQPGVVSPCCISPSSQPPLWKTRCSTSFSPSSLPRLERLGMPAVPGLVALVSIHRKRTHAGRPPPVECSPIWDFRKKPDIVPNLRSVSGCWSLPLPGFLCKPFGHLAIRTARVPGTAPRKKKQQQQQRRLFGAQYIVGS